MKNKAEIRETLMRTDDYENGIRVEATSMVNGGTISWWYDHQKELVMSYGRGQGWCDQGVSEHCLDEAVDYLWKQRKYIQKEVA